MNHATTTNLHRYRIVFKSPYKDPDVVWVSATDEFQARNNAWNDLSLRRCTSSFHLVEIELVR